MRLQSKGFVKPGLCVLKISDGPKSLKIKSNLLVKYNGTVGRLKPCRIRIEGAWEQRKEREQDKPGLVQESLKGVKRGGIYYFHREFIPRNGKSHREGSFPSE